MRLSPFRMERWQSTYENRVRFNLSESGVHPLTVGELLALGGVGEGVEGLRLGYGQSNGTDALRSRIAALYPGAGPENVLVTVGSAEANFVSAWHLAEPGVRAAVMLPNYMQVPGLLEGFGVTPIPFRLREEADGWRIDLDALGEALDGGARIVLVTNPNNPTGAVLEEAEVEAIAREAARAGAWILADEVYRGSELHGGPSPSFWGRWERTLVTSSLSKAYGLPGLRLGWVVGPRETVDRLWARTDYTTISPAVVSDALATAALEPETRARILERTRGILRGNLPLLREWLGGFGDRIRWHPPRAGAIAYFRYDAPVNSSELAERLRVEEDVLVVPGDHFGMDGYLRIGYGLPRGELEEALERVGRVLGRILPEE